jgi:glutathione S-transferase
MLRLHGFSASNYHNVVKLALLEKGLEFEEVVTYTGAGPKYRPDYLGMSPLGKVPCLETERGFISESRCIVQYLEAIARGQGVELLPGDPFERAKHDELYQVLELYLELTARRLLPALLVGAKAHDSLKREVQAVVTKGTAALLRLGRFSPFLTGAAPRAVDFAAAMHLPVVSAVMSKIIGADPLAVEPIEAFMREMNRRPHVQRVRRDAEQNTPLFRAHLRELYG